MRVEERRIPRLDLDVEHPQVRRLVDQPVSRLLVYHHHALCSEWLRQYHGRRQENRGGQQGSGRRDVCCDGSDDPST